MQSASRVSIERDPKQRVAGIRQQEPKSEESIEQANLLLQVSDPTPLVRRHQVSLSWGRRTRWRCPVLRSDLQSGHLCLPKGLAVL